jgi:hypothetical protein
MNNKIIELRFIYDCISQKSNSRKYILNDGHLKKLLAIASKNRVIYAFCQSLVANDNIHISPQAKTNVLTIIKTGHQWLSLLRNTLAFTRQVLFDEKIPFLIVKMYEPNQYVTYDVDVVVHPESYSNAINIFKNKILIGEHPGKQKKTQTDFFSPKFLTIDLHSGFSWQGQVYFDKELIWKNVNFEEIQGISCYVPSVEVKFLLAMAHLLFERRYITLLDILYINYLLNKKPDFKTINNQLNNYGWCHSAFSLLLDIKNILEALRYESDLGASCQILSLPFMLPLPRVLKIFTEKAGHINRIPKWDLSYYFFTTARYYLSLRNRLPYYLEWTPLGDIKW